MPQISVVIPVFNGADTIYSCVRSVIMQSFQDIEVIIVDDCSTDNTSDIVEQIDDPRIRLIKHEVNKGACAARNTGVQASQSDWIAFQDSDDEWLVSKLDKLWAAIQAQGHDLIGAYSSMVVIDKRALSDKRRLKTRHVPPYKYSLRELTDGLASLSLYTNVVSTQTLVVRKSAIIEIGLFDEHLRSLQDWDLVLRLSHKGRIAYIDEPLVVQYIKESGITRNSSFYIDSRERIMQERNALFEQDSNALAFQYRLLAGGHRRQKQYRRALLCYFLSAKLFFLSFALQRK